jgi:hypothetical protein
VGSGFGEQQKGHPFALSRFDLSRLAANVLPIVQPMRAEGKSLRDIAKALDALAVPTARGGKWAARQVADILKRQ